MSHIPEFQFDASGNGVYAAPPSPAALRARAAAQGIAWCVLDLSGVATKKTFLGHCADVLNFPAGFGANWDALADCLEDLSWQPQAGVVVHWHNGAAFANLSADYSTALEIFAAAASYWKQKSRVFLILMDGAGRDKQLLQPLLQR